MSAPSGSPGPRVAIGLIALAAVAAILWPRERDLTAADDGSSARPHRTVLDATASPPPSANQTRTTASLPWLERALTAPAARVSPDPSEPRGRIEGRLAWLSSGLPIEGARVTLTRWSLDSVVPPADLPTALDRPEIEATTDHRGFFLLEDVPRRESWFLRFEREHLAEVRPVRRLPDDSHERTWQGEYRVQEPGTLSGRIVDESGTPLAGVRVRAIDDPLFGHPALPADVETARRRHLELFDPRGNRTGTPLPVAVVERDAMLPFPEATTDGEGFFRLRGVRAGEIELLLQGETHAGSRSRVRVEAFTESDLGRIPLLPAESISIRIVTEDDTPVSGVAVAVRPALTRFGPPPARTDDLGRATFHVADLRGDLPEGSQAVAVSVQRHPGWPWEPIGFADFPEAQLRLASPATWRCRLVTPDGEVLRDARWYSIPPVPELEVRQQPDGVHVFPDLPPDPTLTLVASVPGHSPAVVRLSDSAALGGDFGGIDDLTVFPTFGLTVRVVDEGDEPVQHARVLVHVAGDDRVRWLDGVTWEALGVVPVGTTDADGELRIDGLWSAPTWILVDHPDFGQHFAARIEPEDGAEQVVRVDRWASVRGAIAADFERIDRRLRVVAFHHPFDPDREQPRAPVETVSTDEGFFELPRLIPGRWVLLALDPDTPRIRLDTVEPRARIWAEREVVLDAGTDLHHVVLEVLPPEPPGFAGVVRVGGLPRAGLRVRLHGPVDGAAFETETDAAGEFAFADVELDESARFRIDLQAHGTWTRLAELEVPEDDSGRPVRDVEIDIAVGELELVVRSPEGEPMTHRVLRLAEVDSDNQLVLVTDDSGRASWDAVPPGLWSIEVPSGASAATRLVVEEVFEVVAGEQRELEVQAVTRSIPP